MRARGARAAALLDKHIDVLAAPLDVEAVLSSIIVKSGWSASGEAEIFASEWRDSFVAKIRTQIVLAHSNGQFIPYDFDPEDPSLLQGACYPHPKDTAIILEGKRKRANIYRIRSTIADLNPDQFELLCGNILRLFRVNYPVVSKHSSDQGVDFYGQAPFSDIASPIGLPDGVEKGLKVWFVGQAKHYFNNKVATKEIRELVGSAELARAKIFAGSKDPLRKLEAKLCDPVFYMLITSGVFTRDSRQVIDRSGVIAMDGMQLSQFLADHGKGYTEGDFDRDGLLKWALFDEPEPRRVDLDDESLLSEPTTLGDPAEAISDSSATNSSALDQEIDYIPPNPADDWVPDPDIVDTDL